MKKFGIAGICMSVLVFCSLFSTYSPLYLRRLQEDLQSHKIDLELKDQGYLKTVLDSLKAIGYPKELAFLKHELQVLLADASGSINFAFSTDAILNSKADCFVFFIEEDFTFSKRLQEIAKKKFPNLKALIEQKKFNGGTNSTLLIPIQTNDTVAHLLFLGLGPVKKNNTMDIENLRRALGLLVRLSEKNRFKSLAIQLPPAARFGVMPDYLGKQVATILNMACYYFDQFMTDTSRMIDNEFDIILFTDAKDKREIQKGVKEGEHIAEAVNSARLWVDLPPSGMTPLHLEHNAREIAKNHGMKITIFDEKKINELGMGGIAAVSAGSEREASLVIMEYKTKKRNAPTIALVGKGITFDAGGLSLKLAYMHVMKDDMAGAAAVIAAMDAIGRLKPDINVIGVAPLAENLPSGKAIEPGDIVHFYNGKTAEIKNTDAEGRLILADALSYIVKHYKPDAIIDIATLTGACKAALGPFFCGMMSNNANLAKKVEKAAKLSGERVWALPLDDDYKPAIHSSVADISNLGNKKYKAGAITAAFFLKNFVGNMPWVHLDIAGTAFDVPGISYYRDGATGFGVRLLVELIMNWK